MAAYLTELITGLLAIAAALFYGRKWINGEHRDE